MFIISDVIGLCIEVHWQHFSGIALQCDGNLLQNEDLSSKKTCSCPLFVLTTLNLT
jgi:hypothetical protein